MESELKLNVEILDNGSVLRSEIEHIIIPNNNSASIDIKRYRFLGNKIGEYVIAQMTPHIEEAFDFNFEIEVKIKSNKE